MSLPFQDVAVGRPATSEIEQLRNDVWTGLAGQPKQIPCKYLYDERGSQLFDQICELEEYYLTRVELQILKRHLDEITHQIGTGIRLVELGSGSSIKTHLLLRKLVSLHSYVPVDISSVHLTKTAQALDQQYPKLTIQPLCADFTKPLVLPPASPPPKRSVAFFPGSTIGNFTDPEAVAILRNLCRAMGSDGGLLIGFDLRKSARILQAAYDDRQGITAQFSLNLLTRINRQLDANFNIDDFRHQARYNVRLGRIEIYLVSRRAQQVTVADRRYDFAAGEPILIEYSHKYTRQQFNRLAERAGWRPNRYWTDPQELFALAYFSTEHHVHDGSND